ncbi:NUDIX hydrolase [Rossellomorea aquimaris]|uniref:NUDIX hydrolase n=1 Tax=Rossellomorea aquimaris TaxID=189382 RepID=UPI001CD1CF4D|nr:NUDIX hydrolase [Rossellomorea aquimaris]MCA1055277.1 NUDIX hydrolase [Rossellomorea aquimaris]
MNDYVNTMRRLIGNKTLLTVGCGAIIEDAEGRILLQRRADGGKWGIPGGLMEIGETFEESAIREVFEETNFSINQLQLFGLYSGKNAFATYPNGDQVFSLQIIFFTRNFNGILNRNQESIELDFFSREELPQQINPHQAPFILDWAGNAKLPIIK